MELGSRLKAARQEAGLSQRQLCGDRLTRNMLSQIENGSARPSVKTLEYLAEQLGKPISYFLEEQTVTSPNREHMENARIALAMGDLDGLRSALDAFAQPDAVFFEERQLLEFLWHLRQAAAALKESRAPYAAKLLHRALDMDGLYITSELRHRCTVLLALTGKPVSVECDEEALLARADQAPDPHRALEILAAAEDKASPRWNYRQAQALFALGKYEQAAAHYEKAPQSQQVYARLEICFRELGDYRQAYEYACKQRDETKTAAQ